MARRWIHSADVEVDDNGALLVAIQPTQPGAKVSKTIADKDNVEVVSATSVPCRAALVCSTSATLVDNRLGG